MGVGKKYGSDPPTSIHTSPKSLFKGFPNIPRTPLPTGHSVGLNEATMASTPKNAPSWHNHQRPREICQATSSHRKDQSPELATLLQPSSPTALQYSSLGALCQAGDPASQPATTLCPAAPLLAPLQPCSSNPPPPALMPCQRSCRQAVHPSSPQRPLALSRLAAGGLEGRRAGGLRTGEEATSANQANQANQAGAVQCLQIFTILTSLTFPQMLRFIQQIQLHNMGRSPLGAAHTRMSAIRAK